MVMRVASFFPLQTSYYLSGHSFIEQQTPNNKSVTDSLRNPRRSARPSEGSPRQLRGRRQNDKAWYPWWNTADSPITRRANQIKVLVADANIKAGH
jgi:hypothetical protein